MVLLDVSVSASDIQSSPEPAFVLFLSIHNLKRLLFLFLALYPFMLHILKLLVNIRPPG